MQLSGRRIATVCALMVLALPGLVRSEEGDGPESPVPRTVLEAPKSVWSAIRDPAYGGPIRFQDFGRASRWGLWAQSQPREAVEWIEAHPAETTWIDRHQKLGAWAKTFPDRAKVVDDNQEILDFLIDHPQARTIQKDQTGLGKLMEEGEKQGWRRGGPLPPKKPQPDRPSVTREERRNALMAEGLRGQALEQFLEKEYPEPSGANQRPAPDQGRPPAGEY